MTTSSTKRQPQGRPSRLGHSCPLGRCWSGRGLLSVLAAGLVAITACFTAGCAGAARDVGSADAEADRAATDTSVPETAAAPVAATAPDEPEPVAAETETLWRTEYDEALALAAEQDRPVLLRFTAEWCVPCQVMDKSVFPDRNVKAALAEHAVPVKIDIDEARNADVARRYGIRGIPALLLVDADGKELDRGGFMSAEALVKFVGKS